MADKKISALTAASTPLDGTEVLPIVQSGVTKKTSVASLSSYAPAFSAYQSVAQTGLTSTTVTKLTFTTEEFDTNNNFASSTFTPTVAGYYQVSGAFSIDTLSVLPTALVMFYKNGVGFKFGGVGAGSPSNYVGASASVLIYMNGTTDTLEMYAYVDLNGVLGTYDTRAAQNSTYFQATLVRSA
tara:strand:- start:1883 stop:2434 length:552 start_codon:yes stop_codon:yes gene_type:complete